jgi:hypothetical protein
MPFVSLSPIAELISLSFEKIPADQTDVGSGAVRL